MHHLTVSDAWCVSRRNFVNDLLYNNNIKSSDISKKIKQYGINFILIDFSDHIYPRSDKGPIAKVMNYYSNLKLKEIIKDETNCFYLYKIIK